MLKIEMGILEAASVGLSITAAILCGAVAVRWSVAAIRSIRRGGKLTAEDWLICGVVIGFTGTAVENAFWSIPWGLHYLTSVVDYSLINIGLYVNVIFRQILGGIAAYCHLRAYHQYKKSHQRSHSEILAHAALAGTAVFIALAAR